MSEGTTILRPTKKQRELLEYIRSFIAEHGYSPSYREIMNGLQYNSVATVALHVRNLIQRGHLLKRGRSARSLEVVGANSPTDSTTDMDSSDREKQSSGQWLADYTEKVLGELESAENLIENELDKAFVLVGALKIIGLQEIHETLVPRLAALEQKISQEAENAA